MNKNESSWKNVLNLARQARQPEPPGAPFGFATRVVARAWADEPAFAPALAWGRLTFRAMICSAAIMMMAVVWEAASPSPELWNNDPFNVPVTTNLEGAL